MQCRPFEGPPGLGGGEVSVARKFLRDYRRLLDKPDLFDAVIVGTPDHMHAPIALAAMQLGKHVYCEKPLAHTVSEARAMRLAAEKHGVVTQMGNQIQSHRFYRNAVKLVHDGAIGKVREVHSWQSGAIIWVLPDSQSPAADPVPKKLDWNLWLGVAPDAPTERNCITPGTGASGRISAPASSATSAATFSTRCSRP